MSFKWTYIPSLHRMYFERINCSLLLFIFLFTSSCRKIKSSYHPSVLHFGEKNSKNFFLLQSLTLLVLFLWMQNWTNLIELVLLALSRSDTEWKEIKLKSSFKVNDINFVKEIIAEQGISRKFIYRTALWTRAKNAKTEQMHEVWRVVKKDIWCS